MKDELEDVVVAELGLVGFDLVELRRGGTKNRPLIEVRIDRRDGASVTVDDCARVSRVLEARLDAGGIVPPQYVLQVSSPGERELRTSADWRRFIGRWASVVSPAVGGSIEGKILAVEDAGNGQGEGEGEGEGGEKNEHEARDGVGAGTQSEIIVLEPKAGELRRIPLAAVKKARLAFHV